MVLVEAIGSRLEITIKGRVYKLVVIIPSPGIPLAPTMVVMLSPGHGRSGAPTPAPPHRRRGNVARSMRWNEMELNYSWLHRSPRIQKYRATGQNSLKSRRIPTANSPRNHSSATRSRAVLHAKRCTWSELPQPLPVATAASVFTLIRLLSRCTSVHAYIQVW